MPATPVEVEEVQHVPRVDPVDEVAERPPNDECEPYPGKTLTIRQGCRIHRQAHKGCRLHQSHDRRLERNIERVEQSECGARIVNASQAEKAWNHIDAVEQ